MNNIHHVVLTIEYDVWEPFGKKVETELDDLINMVKTKKVLAHAGNTKLHVKGE